MYGYTLTEDVHTLICVHLHRHTSSNCCFEAGWCNFSCSPCFLISSLCFSSACLRCSSSMPASSCFLSNSFSISYFLNSSRLCWSTFSKSAVVWRGDNHSALVFNIRRSKSTLQPILRPSSTLFKSILIPLHLLLVYMYKIARKKEWKKEKSALYTKWPNIFMY